MKRHRNPHFVKQYRDAAGNWIRQYRRGRKTIRLPNGRDLDDAFWAAYYEAERRWCAEAGQAGAGRTLPGTLDAALVGYYQSPAFSVLAPLSQRNFRGALERDLRPHYGSARLAHMQRKHVEQILADKAQSSPSGARVLHAALRSFLKYCIVDELIVRDPSQGVPLPEKGNPDGYHTWTDDEIARFEAAHAIDSQARLAFALHLYSGQRSSDVRRMGWQHVRNGVLRIVQQKTDAAVAIPIHAELQRVLDAVPLSNMTFLVNGKGGPIVSDYDKLWRRWCVEAGLPKECVPHGLRKAAARRLAEAGCTAHEIAAITGHKTLREVQRYTEAVDRERLAQRAMDRISPRTVGV